MSPSDLAAIDKDFDADDMMTKEDNEGGEESSNTQEMPTQEIEENVETPIESSKSPEKKQKKVGDKEEL